MSDYITYDSAGRIHYRLSNLTLDQAQLSTPTGQLLLGISDNAEVSQESRFVMSGELFDRPEPPEMPNTAAAPWVIPLNSLASGAVVTVSREYGPDIVISNLSEIWDIEDAGTYLIQIEQPFPHHSLTHEIVIEAAKLGGL